jgi:prepilin-type N-terminal cleavage/methylation domain-containing protein
LKHRIRSGFTLVELLIVIIIIAVLASVAVPKFSTSWKSSSESRLKSNLHQYRVAIGRFYDDTGLFPNSMTDIRSQSAPTTGLDTLGTVQPIPPGSWQGPYIKTFSGSTVTHPDLRGTGYKYGILAPEVGNIMINTAQKDVFGIRLNTY